jgi:hypothetical protein
MALWKVTPNWKKSCVERQYWRKGDKTIVQEIGWRWGEFFIATDDDETPELEEGVDIFCCDYELQDWSTDDGCWEEYEYTGFTEEEQEAMEEWLEENSAYELEEDGWNPIEGEMFIQCEMTIEKVED